MTTKVDIYRQAAWRHPFCKATNSLFEPGAIDPSGIELAHPYTRDRVHRLGYFKDLAAPTQVLGLTRSAMAQNTRISKVST